jgi:hypothetical protein
LSYFGTIRGNLLKLKSTMANFGAGQVPTKWFLDHVLTRGLQWDNLPQLEKYSGLILEYNYLMKWSLDHVLTWWLQPYPWISDYSQFVQIIIVYYKCCEWKG